MVARIDIGELLKFVASEQGTLRAEFDKKCVFGALNDARPGGWSGVLSPGETYREHEFCRKEAAACEGFKKSEQMEPCLSDRLRALEAEWSERAARRAALAEVRDLVLKWVAARLDPSFTFQHRHRSECENEVDVDVPCNSAAAKRRVDFHRIIARAKVRNGISRDVACEFFVRGSGTTGTSGRQAVRASTAASFQADTEYMIGAFGESFSAELVCDLTIDRAALAIDAGKWEKAGGYSPSVKVRLRNNGEKSMSP